MTSEPVTAGSIQDREDAGVVVLTRLCLSVCMWNAEVWMMADKLIWLL